MIGRQRGLGIKVKTEGGKCEFNLVNKPPNKLFTEFKENFFSRNGCLEGHETNAQFKGSCAPKQQKGRSIPLQFQISVEKEFKIYSEWAT